MSNDGHGMTQDYVKAAQWYRRAAEQGEVHAQHNLGVYYATGKLGPIDNVSAYMWFSLATASVPVTDPGYRLSVSIRNQAEKLMTPIRSPRRSGVRRSGSRNNAHRGAWDHVDHVDRLLSG